MITVKIQMQDLTEKFEKRVNRAQFLLDSQIVQDTSPFVPFRTGMLDSSVMRASQIGDGEIVYDTPYAREVYYGISNRTGRKLNFNKTFHPLASAQWIEQSKSAYLEKWTEIVKEILSNDN